MIRLNCFIRVEAGRRDGVLNLGRHLVDESLAQDGCVAYDMYESVTRPGDMMICETWRDQAALDAHSESPVFKAVVPQIRELAEMKLERFDF